ncbi:MAG: hypothetical protein H6R00_3904 [Proteobacteria bacterium]|nr:hypothetical protein [Pseudomonadota bacterium]
MNSMDETLKAFQTSTFVNRPSGEAHGAVEWLVSAARTPLSYAVIRKRARLLAVDPTEAAAYPFRATTYSPKGINLD